MVPARNHETAAAAQRLLRLSYVGFVSLGLPDTVLGAAWPSLRAELALPLDAGGLVLLVTTFGVVVSSVSSSRLRRRWGTGSVLAVSTVLAAAALALTATAQHWGVIVGAALVAGLGGGAIDAALNEHVARHHSARHLTWLHACWGIGAATAPLVVAAVLAASYSWRWAYGALAGLELVLSLSFLRTLKLWDRAADTAHGEDGETERGALRRPMVASVCLFYAYCGLEAGTGLWAASYLIATHAISKPLASALVALFWGALTVGRIVAGVRADVMGPTRVVRFASISALLSCAALALPRTPTWVATLALAALGLSLAPIYPLVMHDTPSRFRGSLGTRLVGYQVAAGALGTATLPWLLGAASARTSLAVLPVLLLVVAASLLLLQRARLQ